MVNNLIHSYLNNYAESETTLLSAFPDQNYLHVLVIPAYQEQKEFIEQYRNNFREIKLLLVLVINQPVSDHDQSPQKILSDSLENCQTLWSSDNLTLLRLSDSCDILLVRRFENDRRIPDKYGVGLARKIGADLALALINREIISSPWIAFTDADAKLPLKYFSTIAKQDITQDALTFDYNHQGDKSELLAATKLYETGLKYFQTGLNWAGSRYAFHAVGSCIVVNSRAYAIHRGMPKRPAGEDFYLLNKIAKRGQIKHLPDCQISIQCRISDRTPFGTGTAVNQILATESNGYEYYHPQCFSHLKDLLITLSDLPVQQTYSDWLASLAEEHRPILDTLGFEKYHAHHQKQNLSQLQLRDDIHCWFDGLKTLQFIHALRDQLFPNIPLRDALASAPFDLN